MLSLSFHKWNWCTICDSLCNLVPFVQFKKREKHPWRKVTFIKVAGNFTKSSNPPWVFSRFLNCTNGTKSCNTSHLCSQQWPPVSKLTHYCCTINSKADIFCVWFSVTLFHRNSVTENHTRHTVQFGNFFSPSPWKLNSGIFFHRHHENWISRKSNSFVLEETFLMFWVFVVLLFSN